MESHEERLHKMIIQSKINETKDVMKRKAMEIDKSKLSDAKLVRCLLQERACLVATLTAAFTCICTTTGRHNHWKAKNSVVSLSKLCRWP